MYTRHRSGRRTAALVAAFAVTGVTAAGVVAGTASAAGTGTCTSSVNVRSEPSTTAPVVGTCEKGETTRVGETRNGFVQLDEFGGWASAQYVSTGAAGTSAPNEAEDGTDTAESSDQATNPERTGTGD